MSWYRKITIIFSILGIAACRSENKTPDIKNYYFNIRSFFNSEAQRLQKSNTSIQKKVYDGKSTEQKQVHIDSWATELELFTESDINRASWKNSYMVKNHGDTTLYLAARPDLRTKQIVIVRNGSRKVRYIGIKNKTENFLYTSSEELSYYPDSLYRIDKHQKVKILGAHHYLIEGNF